jgi:hypothetical protein
MKTTTSNEKKSMFKVPTIILCAGFLAGLTVASLAVPVYHSIDTWCNDVANQIILACSAFLILLSFGIWWMVKKCME